MTEAYLPGDYQASPAYLDEVPPRTSDPDIQKILDQIAVRQKETREKISGLTAADLAFALMRRIPRKDWNTPLSKLGHWPRGVSIAETKGNPQLLNYTPAQAILQLFEMDDQMRARRADAAE